MPRPSRHPGPLRRSAAVEGTAQEGESLERGRDFSRIAAFSDGVFAIAITLLILQIEMPSGATTGTELWSGLKDESGDFFAFGLSFAVIGAFWAGHHRFMRTLSGFDGGLIWRNLAYLGSMVLIPFMSQLTGDYGDIPLAVALYAANLAILTLLQIAMITHALKADLLEPSYREHSRQARRSLGFMAAVFGVTAPFAFLVGTWITLTWLIFAFNPYDRQKARTEPV